MFAMFHDESIGAEGDGRSPMMKPAAKRVMRTTAPLQNRAPGQCQLRWVLIGIEASTGAEVSSACSCYTHPEAVVSADTMPCSSSSVPSPLRLGPAETQKVIQHLHSAELVDEGIDICRSCTGAVRTFSPNPCAKRKADLLDNYTELHQGMLLCSAPSRLCTAQYC